MNINIDPTKIDYFFKTAELLVLSSSFVVVLYFNNDTKKRKEDLLAPNIDFSHLNSKEKFQDFLSKSTFNSFNESNLRSWLNYRDLNPKSFLIQDNKTFSAENTFEVVLNTADSDVAKPIMLDRASEVITFKCLNDFDKFEIDCISIAWKSDNKKTQFKPANCKSNSFTSYIKSGDTFNVLISEVYQSNQYKLCTDYSEFNEQCFAQSVLCNYKAIDVELSLYKRNQKYNFILTASFDIGGFKVDINKI